MTFPGPARASSLPPAAPCHLSANSTSSWSDSSTETNSSPSEDMRVSSDANPDIEAYFESASVSLTIGATAARKPTSR